MPSVRPTVGEALKLALRTLPSVIGAALLFFAGYLLATLVVVSLGAGLASVSGVTALAARYFIGMAVPLREWIGPGRR